MPDEPFARVPERLLGLVSDRAVHVYAMLDRYAGQDGHAFPFRSTLATRLECSVDSIDRALAELVGAECLVIESGQASGSRNRYTLTATYRTHAAPRRTEAAPPPQGVGTPAAPLRHRNRADQPEPITTPLHVSRPSCETCGGGGWFLPDDSNDAIPCPTCRSVA